MLTAHGRHRYEELDSLRGVAAMVVVLYHASTFWNDPHPWWWIRINQSPLGLLMSGPDAVYLFFVMSGFVLFLPYIRPEGPDPYTKYLIKRVCRIYLPYLVALALAIAADLMFYRPAAAMFTKWVTWVRPFPVGEVWRHIVFVGNDGLTEFNPAFWSLVYEMRISILFPVVAFLALRMRLLVGVVVSLAICSGGFYFADLLSTASLKTVGYGGLFVLGALLARHLPTVRAWMEKRNAFERTMLLVLAVFLFKSTHLLPVRFYQWWTLVPLHGAGAALVLVLSMTTIHFRTFLHTRALRWLGKVSFSLYLVHGIILYSLASVFWLQFRHHVALLCGGIGFSLVLSEYLYEWIERPAILLGRRLTRNTG